MTHLDDLSAQAWIEDILLIEADSMRENGPRRDESKVRADVAELVHDHVPAAQRELLHDAIHEAARWLSEEMERLSPPRDRLGASRPVLAIREALEDSMRGMALALQAAHDELERLLAEAP